MKHLPILAVILVLFSGCVRYRYVTDYVKNTDTLYQKVEVIDSVDRLVHDSVYLQIKGDTVYKYKEKIINSVRYLYRTDTVYKARTDTVYQKVETVKEKSRPWKKRLIGWLIPFILGSIISIYAYRRICS